MWKNRHNECVKVGDREIWISRSCAVVNVVTIENNKKVLLVKRGSGSPDEIGKWCLPCGYLDYDETLYDAARREVWEETGLDLLKEGFVSLTEDQPWYVKSSPSSNRQNIAMHYVWKPLNHIDEPKVHSENSEPNEVADIKWALVSDVLDNQYDLAFNHLDVVGMLIGNGK